MKSIEKSTFLTGIIVLLLFLNLGIVAFLWMNQHEPRAEGRPDVGRFLIDELKMNEQQQAQYEELKEEHHNKIEHLQQQDRELHDRFFDLLRTPSADSLTIETLADSMAANRKQIEIATYQHFQKVRAICNAEQQKKFDAVTRQMLRMMGPPPPPGR